MVFMIPGLPMLRPMTALASPLTEVKHCPPQLGLFVRHDRAARGGHEREANSELEPGHGWHCQNVARLGLGISLV